MWIVYVLLAFHNGAIDDDTVTWNALSFIIAIKNETQ